MEVGLATRFGKFAFNGIYRLANKTEGPFGLNYFVMRIKSFTDS